MDGSGFLSGSRTDGFYYAFVWQRSHEPRIKCGDFELSSSESVKIERKYGETFLNVRPFKRSLGFYERAEKILVIAARYYFTPFGSFNRSQSG